MLYVQVAVNGFLLGGLYALMAVGMSLIWGVMDIINIAHGVFIMLGAYATYWLFVYFGVDPFISIIPSMALLFALGYFIQRYIINLVVRGDVFLTLLLTFGIEIFFMNLARWAWTSNLRRVTVGYAGSNLTLGGITIPYVRLYSFIIIIVLTAVLFYILEKTWVGRAIRATSQDLDAARLAGVDVARTYGLTFGIGVSLAAAAGTLWSVLFAVTPGMGGSLTLKSFVVTILGGLGTVVGPLIGGVVLGVVESFGAYQFGQTYQHLISFSILVIVLILMPEGILGWRKR